MPGYSDVREVKVTGERILADLMTTEFDTCPVDEAAERETSPDMVVVVDEDHGLRWVLGPAGPAPAVILPAATPLDEILDHNGITRMLSQGVPGIVITEGRAPAGIVPGHALYTALASRGVGDPRGAADAADSELFGRSETISSPVRIRCKRCGAWNGYDSYLPGDQVECVNGHPLVPEWT